MSGFGKFIGLLAVGAIGFVVYSCIVYDPDTASSPDSTSVKSTDLASVSEINTESPNTDFDIVGDWLWDGGREGSSYFRLYWTGSADFYGVYNYDLRWTYEDNKLTFLYYEKDGGLFPKCVGSVAYNITVIDNDTIIVDDYMNEYKFTRGDVDDEYKKIIGDFVGDLFD